MNDARSTVYVVDDDDALRDLLCRYVRRLGCAVRAYPNGEAFLADVRPDSAGCVLLNLGLPGLSGLDVLSRLTTAATELAVVAVTAHGDVRTAVDAMRAGAVQFLEKSVAPDELRAAVNEALARSSERRAAAGRPAKLSPLQWELLKLAFAGVPPKEAAEELGIGLRAAEAARAAALAALRATCDFETLFEDSAPKQGHGSTWHRRGSDRPR